MVTGRLPMARKMPLKSLRCSGSSSARASCTGPRARRASRWIASAFLLVLAGGGELLAQALDVLGHEDEAAEADDAVALEEHVLGAAQADAFGAHLDGAVGVARDVGVGADAQLAVLVGPLHELVVLLEEQALVGLQHAVLDLDDLGGLDLDLPDVDRAGEAGEADVVAFADDLAAGGERSWRCSRS